MTAPAASSIKPTIDLGLGLEVNEQVAMMIDPVSYALAGGWTFDPWQAEFLRCTDNYRFLNCSRQSGKSTTTGWGVVHTCTYFANSLILLVSPGERQSTELMRKVKEAMGKAPFVPGVISDGMLHVEFDNGSRILALPGKEETVRGYSSVTRLVIDEASRVPDALYIAVRPMLAVSGGGMDALSTPFGTRGWWYDEYKAIGEANAAGKQPEFRYFEIPATKCPRITKKFLAKELLRLGEWYYGQEYMCKFFDANSAAFTRRDVDAAFAEDVLPWRIFPGEQLFDFEDEDGEVEQWTL